MLRCWGLKHVKIWSIQIQTWRQSLGISACSDPISPLFVLIRPLHEVSIENVYMLWDMFRVTLRKSDFCKPEESSSERQWTPGEEFLTSPQYFLISHCWYWTVCDWHWLQPKVTYYKQTTLPSFSRLCGHASCSLCRSISFNLCQVCGNFSDVAHGVVVLQLGLMQGLIHSHLVVIGPCKKIWDPDWMIYCGVGATQGLIMDLSIKTKKWVLGYVWNSW